MLDRLISGAGALTDRADRFARLFSRRAAGDLLGHRPGSVVVAAVLVVLAVVLVFVGLEATDNPTPRTIGPAVGTGEDIGSRTFSTISGAVSVGYVVTYQDENGNETQDPGEDETEWFYFLVDPETRQGVTVRSSRSPHEIYRMEASGKVVEDASYIAEDESYFDETVRELGITLDDRRLLDTTLSAGPSPQVIDLAADLPADGTEVTVSGERSPTWVPVCQTDANGNGTCDDDEVDSYDVIVYDGASKRGVVVVTRESPEFTPVTFSGMLRRDERAVSEAKTATGLDFDTLELDVSERYILDEGTAPASAPLAFGLAALCGLAAGIILIGLAGGYLIYRRGDARLPARATTMAIGERVPLRVTGVLRTAGGQVHVREAPADLLRFETVVPAPAEPPAPAVPSGQGEATAAGEPPATATVPPIDAPSTLIIERRDQPEGVAVGLGELQRLTAGTVYPLRGARPALRAVAGTGPLFLSFATEADRDRAAAELLEETGLGDRDATAIDPPTTPPDPKPAPEEA